MYQRAMCHVQRLAFSLKESLKMRSEYDCVSGERICASST